MPDYSKLVAEAWKARERSYSPYSGFAVGAALLANDGSVFHGANVENVSFGLTICAERVAVGSAVVAGVTEFEAIAIVADSQEPICPCGACRQVLAEFCPDIHMISKNLSNEELSIGLTELFPKPSQGILK